MADLFSRALAFHGFAEIIDPAKYGGGKEAAWSGLGADFVYFGKYQQAGGKEVIEGRIFDVGEDRMLAGRRYTGTPGQRDDMVLRLADGLVEDLTGEQGISRSKLAFISDTTGRKEVYVVDILGRKVRKVTSHNTLCVSPRLAPDNFTLAYSSYHSGNQSLYMTDLRQDKVTRAISRRRGMNMGPAFSPDGRHMIVTLSKDGSPDLYKMDLKGKIIDRLTTGSSINVSASYSPDGKSIVFVSDRSRRPQVYRMDLKSRQTQLLTFRGNENTEPVWSPKGDLIAYTGLHEGTYQIFVMEPRVGATPEKISSGWGEFESPTWSPDGNQIAFSRRRNGKQEICAVNKNGSNLRVLFKLKGNQSYPQWSRRLK
jgi:TolB protein